MKWSNEMTTMDHEATPEQIEIAALNMPIGFLAQRFNEGATPEDVQITVALNDRISVFLRTQPPSVKRRHVGMMVTDMAMEIAEAEIEVEWSQAEPGGATGRPDTGGGTGGDSPFGVDFSAGLAKVIAEHAAGTLSAEKEAVVVAIFGRDVFKPRPLQTTTRHSIPSRQKIAWLMRMAEEQR
jgi:hypothetical protein